MKHLLKAAVFLLLPYLSFGQVCSENYVLKTSEPVRDSIHGFFQYYSYIDTCGNVVIPDKKYILSYTENFNSIAFVLKDRLGLVAIDKEENILFHVFWHENGPDLPSEDLFRIVEGGVIGYADLNGTIIIKPQFQCAYPFEEGKAKVSNDCKKIKEGEQYTWTSKNWFYINKQGRQIRD